MGGVAAGAARGGTGCAKYSGMAMKGAARLNRG